MNRLNEKDYLWNQVLLDRAEYFQQEKEYLMNLLLHTSGHDAFIQYMTEINTDAFTNYLQSHCKDICTYMESFAALGYKPGQVTKILLTHRHADHFGELI